MTHWAAGYIGAPWDATENHCWSFCRRVWREQFGLDVADIDVDMASPSAVRRAMSGPQSGWDLVEVPQDGDAVLMAKGRYPCHVGVWAQGGILHAVERTGVIFTATARLIGLGYRITGIYRRVE